MSAMLNVVLLESSCHWALRVFLTSSVLLKGPFHQLKQCSPFSQLNKENLATQFFFIQRMKINKHFNVVGRGFFYFSKFQSNQNALVLYEKQSGNSLPHLSPEEEKLYLFPCQLFLGNEHRNTLPVVVSALQAVML